MALFPANSESWSPGGPLPRPLENGGASWDNPQTQLLHGVVKSWARLSDSTTAALPRDKVLSSESQLEAETEAGAGCLRGVSTDTSSLANGVTAGVCVCACVCVWFRSQPESSVRVLEAVSLQLALPAVFPAGRASAPVSVLEAAAITLLSPEKKPVTSCPGGEQPSYLGLVPMPGKQARSTLSFFFPSDFCCLTIGVLM